MVRDSALIIPEMMDVLRKGPLILSEGIKMLESNQNRPPSGPLNGIRGTLLAGFCLLGGTMILAFNGPWFVWAILFVVAFILAIQP
jgi:ubiquinone biosynthesis protein